MIMRMGKKIICIKDIPSNLIEEAIFILKSDDLKNKNPKLEIKTKEIILDEAEVIVEEYVKKIQDENKKEKEIRISKVEQVKKEAIYLIGVFIIAGIFISIVI